MDRRGVRDRFRAAASGEALDHLLRQSGKILIGERDDGIDGLRARELLREVQTATPSSDLSAECATSAEASL